MDSSAIVSASAGGGILLSMLVTLVGPILFLIVWYLKKKCNLMPALAGGLTFIVFALFLENIPKYILFSGANPVSEYILNNAWAFSVIGALLAGIFEECGRFVAFRFFLDKHQTKETAITYGIGHGGIECMLLVGLGMLSNFVLACLINSGALENLIAALPPEQADAYASVTGALTTATFVTFLWSIWERIFAMILHIALSVLVFAAVKNKSKFYFLPAAILLHALLDFPAALYQFGVVPLAATELLIAVLSIGSAWLAYREYRNMI